MAKAHSTLKTIITKTRTVKLRSNCSLTVGYKIPMASNLTPDRNSSLKTAGWKPSALPSVRQSSSTRNRDY